MHLSKSLIAATGLFALTSAKHVYSSPYRLSASADNFVHDFHDISVVQHDSGVYYLIAEPMSTKGNAIFQVDVANKEYGEEFIAYKTDEGERVYSAIDFVWRSTRTRPYGKSVYPVILAPWNNEKPFFGTEGKLYSDGNWRVGNMTSHGIGGRATVDHGVQGETDTYALCQKAELGEEKNVLTIIRQGIKVEETGCTPVQIRFGNAVSA